MRAGIAIAASVTVALALVGGAAAVTVPLKGTQTVVDESKGSYEMQGSLLGKWQVTAFSEHYATASRFVGTGKERFTGCLDANRSRSCDAGEPAGSLRFAFTYWASFNPATKALLRGACVHPIVGGTGAFAKAKGIIHMKDVPVGKTVRTTYTGELTSATLVSTTATGPPSSERALLAHSGGPTCGR